jgi:hypothetical protein
LFDIARVVRYRSNADFFENDHRAATPDNTEEDIIRFRSLKCDLEAETVAIKRERGGNIFHDEERRNPRDFRFSHVSDWPA